LRVVRLPLVSAFGSSIGLETVKEALLVIIEKEGVIAYGECVAGTAPWYNEETIPSANYVIKQFLTPLLFAKDFTNPRQFLDSTRTLRGNNMAVASVEMALWDLMGKLKGQSLSKLLEGRKTEVQVGVSVGIQPSIHSLVDRVAVHLAEGYRRIKIKIKPGYDIQPLGAIRKRFPDVPLQVDANSAYTLQDSPLLRQLDAFNLLLIEQPLAHDDIFDHSKLQKQLSTRICLDESIRSVDDARQAVEIDACRVINIKPGRLRGLEYSKELHDFCVAQRIPVWCGGMLETGIGRAFNVALASLPGFTLPGDTSASKLYFKKDIIAKEFELTEDGTLEVPREPGMGVQVDKELLESHTVSKHTITRGQFEESNHQLK
jgi:O-succinylbenzoate synthase